MKTVSTSVSLREVTASTVRAVTELRVSSEQESYVASNAVSIAQAYFEPKAWFRAIYNEDELAGFVMLRDSTIVAPTLEAREISLWRFMIDRRFQGLGLGRKALTEVVEHVRAKSCASELVTSYVPGPDSPVGFYLSFGFVATGEIKTNGEHCLSYSL